MDRIFFSKNRKTALAYLHELAERDIYYKGEKPSLSKRQIPHISGWKTWRVTKRRH